MAQNNKTAPKSAVDLRWPKSTKYTRVEEPPKNVAKNNQQPHYSHRYMEHQKYVKSR